MTAAATISPSISVRYVPSDSLHPASYNPRVMPEDEMAALMRSIATFGFAEPVVVRRGDGLIVGGHQRVEAAKRLGMVEVPIVELDLSDEQAKALNVALNRIHGEFDIPKLAEILASLPHDLQALTGFDEAEMRRVAAEAQAAIEASLCADGIDDVPPLPEIAVTKPGDLWELGRHRLLCGDATSEPDVKRVLGGSVPFLAVVDPPYGVSYDPTWRNAAGLSDTARTGAVRNDDRFDWRAAYALFPGDVIYVWHAGRFGSRVAEGLEATGFQIRAQLIWSKSRFAISRGAYHWAHEPCYYAVRDGASARWCGDRSQSTVWEIANVASAESDDVDDATVHGTQKPVECMARPMRNHGTPGDGVYDGFVGSGSTIIAAERLDRVAHAIELDPRYVDVAVARWESLSGKKAERRSA